MIRVPVAASSMRTRNPCAIQHLYTIRMIILLLEREHMLNVMFRGITTPVWVNVLVKPLSTQIACLVTTVRIAKNNVMLIKLLILITSVCASLAL